MGQRRRHRIWQGTIRLTHGKFSNLRALGIEADEPGSIWLDAEGIEIRQRSFRAYDGVDVTVTAELDDQLVISLSSDRETAAKPIEIPLRSIASQSHSSTLDETGNRLLVSRSAGDRLRIQFDRDNLVFSPGETFQFAFPHICSARRRGVALQGDAGEQSRRTGNLDQGIRIRRRGNRDLDRDQSTGRRRRLRLDDHGRAAVAIAWAIAAAKAAGRGRSFNSSSSTRAPNERPAESDVEGDRNQPGESSLVGTVWQHPVDFFVGKGPLGNGDARHGSIRSWGP